MATSQSDFIDVIRRGLATLAASDGERRVFGSGSHSYKLNPPLSEEVVMQFERQWRCELPEEYRCFLRELGDGGAGPYYGVFPLGRAHLGSELVSFADWGFDLSKPFPHTEAWNDDWLMDEGAPQREDFSNEDDYEAALEEWRESEAAQAAEDAYFDAYGTGTGSIPLCHRGCGFRDWLIVSGPERGNVWYDMAPDRLGVEPIATQGRSRVTFAEWYLEWLQESLRKLELKL